MRHLVHIISDLHLGGASASADGPGFQMCPPSTHRLLAQFIDTVPATTAAQDSHLVIAGDVVDFLAEAPFEAFTVDPASACAKLQSIFDSSSVVWDALARFARERGGRLTLMLGNHDIELSLPGVRQMLLERVGGERVRFIYDNEAFTLGPLLIEHGNRFDAWNAVPHSALRRVRSQLSRQLPVAPGFDAPPGSRLVIDVINPLKRDYPFVDLLKPENAAAFPVAAALGCVGLQQAWNFFGKYRASRSVDFDEGSGEPVNANYVAATPSADAALWNAAQAIAHGANANQVGAFTDVLAKGAAVVGEKVRQARIDAVYAAFRQLAGARRMHRDTFDVGKEDGIYLKPATRAAQAGFKLVVYGHTHLPKRVPMIAPGGQEAVYFNSGTWADVMCVPEGIWDEDEERGRDTFRAFASDLGDNRLSQWRSAIPTYVRIDLDGDRVIGADLFLAGDEAPLTTARLMQRLTPARLQ
jgi:UDP-2,3-diacylglucosamine pyrophosphatase LpxH